MQKISSLVSSLSGVKRCPQSSGLEFQLWRDETRHQFLAGVPPRLELYGIFLFSAQNEHPASANSLLGFSLDGRHRAFPTDTEVSLLVASFITQMWQFIIFNWFGIPSSRQGHGCRVYEGRH